MLEDLEAYVGMRAELNDSRLKGTIINLTKDLEGLIFKGDDGSVHEKKLWELRVLDPRTCSYVYCNTLDRSYPGGLCEVCYGLFYGDRVGVEDDSYS